MLSSTNTSLVAFTICSNNYLALARAWVESMRRFAPDFRLVIGLVDEIQPGVNYDSCAPAEIVPISTIGIPDFDEMVLRYRIVELNTAVKPFLFKHLFTKFGTSAEQIVLYFDPDIKIFAPLKPILKALEDSSILLTPHILSPVPDSHAPFGEHLFLNYGIYNLGFCGMRWTPETAKALDWWSDRLEHQCKDDVRNGLYVDQLWANLIPIFFKEVNISKNIGLDVAYWNLHERRLSEVNGTWFVNNDTPLVFYHFSSFEYSNSQSLGKFSVHYNLSNRPEMAPLFDQYRAELRANGHEQLRMLPCAYVEAREAHLKALQVEYFKKHPIRHFVKKLKCLVPLNLLTRFRTTTSENAIGI
ncbi:MAG: hypothetical protein QM790_06975 [Nibricoccus sp.]